MRFVEFSDVLRLRGGLLVELGCEIRFFGFGVFLDVILTFLEYRFYGRVLGFSIGREFGTE